MVISHLAALFLAASSTFSLPEGLLSSVCFVESGHRVHVMNLDDQGSPSLGVCQVKYETAKFLGFKGSYKALMVPRTNIYYAAKYLRYQLDRYREEIDYSVSAYNSGTCRLNKYGLIRNRDYVQKVLKAMKEGR